MKMVKYCPYVLSRKFHINGGRFLSRLKFSMNFSNVWDWSLIGKRGNGFAWSMREFEL